MIHAAFAHSEIEDDYPEWRIYWIAGVACLRAVGQVLDKVDAPRDPKLKAIVERKWQWLKSNRATTKIFWEFIDKERDNILKEFALGPVPSMVAQYYVPSAIPGKPDEPRNLYRGLVYGDDNRTAEAMFWEAIEFWRSYLGEIQEEWANG